MLLHPLQISDVKSSYPILKGATKRR